MSRKVCLVNLGLTEYGKVYQLQKRLLEERKADRCPDTLILCEHLPVFTIGRTGSSTNVVVEEKVYRAAGIELVHIDRGGDITYHGPGQLVAYPVLDLKNYGRDVHKYIRKLEEVIVRLLSKFDVKGERKEGYTGVWVGDEKIAAIGIGVSKWVSYHGIAFNVDPDMSHFSMIVPCGLKRVKVTSLSATTGRQICVDEALKQRFVESFEEVFGVRIETGRRDKRDESCFT